MDKQRRKREQCVALALAAAATIAESTVPETDTKKAKADTNTAVKWSSHFKFNEHHMLRERLMVSTCNGTCDYGNPDCTCLLQRASSVITGGSFTMSGTASSSTPPSAAAASPEGGEQGRGDEAVSGATSGDGNEPVSLPLVGKRSREGAVEGAAASSASAATAATTASTPPSTATAPSSETQQSFIAKLTNTGLSESSSSSCATSSSAGSLCGVAGGLSNGTFGRGGGSLPLRVGGFVSGVVGAPSTLLLTEKKTPQDAIAVLATMIHNELGPSVATALAGELEARVNGEAVKEKERYVKLHSTRVLERL